MPAWAAIWLVSTVLVMFPLKNRSELVNKDGEDVFLSQVWDSLSHPLRQELEEVYLMFAE